jgi:uncharacterized protein (TIGR03435 family)
MQFPAVAALVLCVPLLAAAQEFEAATIKPSGPQTGFGVHGGPGTGDPGMMTWSNTWLGTLVATAFDVPPDRIANPGILARAPFDVVAKLPAGAMKEQVPVMLRKLLEARFHMTAHTEMRDSAVWVMTAAKSGPKLKPAGQSDPSPNDLRSIGAAFQVDKEMFPVPARGEGATIGLNGATHLAARAITTAKLADLLSADAGRPIVDKTGLTGTYDVRLSFMPAPKPNAAPPPPGGPGAPAQADNLNGPPTIFDALRHDLGLRLDSGKGPVKFIVIDRMDSAPVGN